MELGCGQHLAASCWHELARVSAVYLGLGEEVQGGGGGGAGGRSRDITRVRARNGLGRGGGLSELTGVE